MADPTPQELAAALLRYASPPLPPTECTCGYGLNGSPCSVCGTVWPMWDTWLARRPAPPPFDPDPALVADVEGNRRATRDFRRAAQQAHEAAALVCPHTYRDVRPDGSTFCRSCGADTSCPRPGDDSCTDATPCDPCPSCRWCGESWQRHIDGNACSELPEPQSPVSPCSGVRDVRDGAGWYWETPGAAS